MQQLTLTGDALLEYNAIKAGATQESLAASVALQKEINAIKAKNEADKEAARIKEAKTKADDKAAEQAKAKREVMIASAQKNLTVIEQSLMSERELVAAYAAEDIARITADRDAKLISLQEFETAKNQIEQAASDVRKKISEDEEVAKNEVRMQALGALSGFTSQLSSIAEEGSREAKVLFALQKAIAIAQIIVSTEAAAATASAFVAGAGPVAWLTSVQGIRAMGYASAGLVAGTAIAGRATGGQVRSGESYLVGERGPELLSMGTSGRIATNENLKRAVNSDQESSKTQNVNVNFSIVANDTTGFDRLLHSRRGQIVTMINQAVNNRGRASLT